MTDFEYERDKKLPATNEIAETVRQRIIDGYLQDPLRLKQDHQKENAEIEGYHGRELLELLQNAEDEIEESTEEKTVRIELEKTCLRVSNNGRVFSAGGLVSLMYSNLSPKHDDANYIGNKGTGFRAILNWATAVRIYSGELSVKFSKKNATEMKEALFKELGEKEISYDKTSNVAILVAPKSIPPTVKEFDTVIEIDFEEGFYEDIRKQMKALNGTLLLFLEKIEKLLIVQDGDERSYEKKRNDDGVVLETVENGKKEREEWKIRSDKGDCDGARYSIAIAYKSDLSTEAGQLYSYFPTKEDFPFSVLAHGTFDLSADRNHLSENERNATVLKKLCELLLDTALKLPEEKCGYQRLRFACLRGNFPEALRWSEIEEFYFEKIEKSKLFPTVNGEYISFEKAKFYTDTEFASFVGGAQFAELLQYTKDEEVKKLLKKLAKRRGETVPLEYGYKELTEKLNEYLPLTDCERRGNICREFLKIPTVISALKEKDAEYPQFFIDGKDKPIEVGKVVYFPPEGGQTVAIPEFSKLIYMKGELFTALKKAFGEISGENSNRNLSQKLSALNVREYTLEPLVRGVFSEVKDDAERCKAAIRWLYSLKNTEQVRKENLMDYVLLLNKNGEIKKASELYLGADYGESVMERLLPEKQDLFVAPIGVYGVPEEEKESFISFLKEYGLSFRPRIQTVKIKGKDESEYIGKVVKSLGLESSLSWNKQQDAVTTAQAFDCYDLILSQSSQEDIFNWLRDDRNAYELVVSTEEDKDKASFEYAYRKDNQRVEKERICSFMHYKFQTEQWLKRGGEAFSVTQCLLQTTRTDFGVTLLPYAINLPAELLTEEIKKLLLSLGAKATFADLSSEELYGILLKLPDFDKEGSVSRALYACVAFDYKQDLDESGENYLRYKKEGKVYCREKGFCQYAEAKYFSQKVVGRSLLKKYSQVDIASRKSGTNIRKYLLVEPFSEENDMKVEEYSEPVPSLGNAFAEDLETFKIYALAYRIQQLNGKEPSDKDLSIRSLTVRLCSSVRVAVSGEKVDLEDFGFVKFQKETFLKIPEDIRWEDLKNSLQFSGAIAEIVLKLWDLKEDELFAPLRSLYREGAKGRALLIEQDHDTSDYFEKAKTYFRAAKERKELFLEVCKQFSQADVTAFVEETDFYAPNGRKSAAAAFIGIVKELRVDEKAFREACEEKLSVCFDLREYYVSELEKLRKSNNDKYKNALFTFLREQNAEEQKKFVGRIEEYERHDYLEDVPNSAEFDPQTYFNQKWFENLPTENLWDAENAWKENYAELVKRLSDRTLLSVFLEDNERTSMVYFNLLDELVERYVEFLEKKRQEADSKEREEEAFEKDFEIGATIVECIAPKTVETNADRKKRKGTKKSFAPSEQTTEKQGRKAERKVYEWYCKTYGKVKWRSENAKKEGFVGTGQAGLGCDLEYEDENGKTWYVEIKSTKSEAVRFIMSENELRFAEEQSKLGQYEIALLINYGSRDAKIKRLQNLFRYQEGETRADNSSFLLTSDSYVISAEERE